MSQSISERICRICLSAEDKQLVSPCQCTGSIQFVHQECLKTWILQNSEETAVPKCEICSTQYIITFTDGSLCNSKVICRESLLHCLFAPLLISVLLMLGIMSYLILDSFINQELDQSHQLYASILLIACAIGSSILMYLIAKSCRDTCQKYKVKLWNIENYISEEEENQVKSEIVQITTNNVFDETIIWPDTQNLMETQTVRNIRTFLSTPPETMERTVFTRRGTNVNQTQRSEVIDRSSSSQNFTYRTLQNPTEEEERTDAYQEFQRRAGGTSRELTNQRNCKNIHHPF